MYIASYLRTWDETFEILKKHKSKYGTCNVKEREDKRLHIWVMNQRAYYKRNELARDR